MAIKPIAIAFCWLLFLDDRARGLVDGAQLATDDFARSVVGIVGPAVPFALQPQSRMIVG
jgi:hypothetical protein